MTISTALLVAAFIMFLVAVAVSPARVNLTAGGLALWVLSILVERLQ